MARVAEVWSTRPSEMMGIRNVLRAYWFDHQMAVLLTSDRKSGSKTPMAHKTLDNLRKNDPSVDWQVKEIAKRKKPVNYKSQGAFPQMTEDSNPGLTRNGIRKRFT